MVWIIIYAFISVLVIVFTAIPIVRERNLFKHGHMGMSTVVNVTSVHDMNKNKQHRIEVKYDVDGHTYSHLFTLKEKECTLQKGDSIQVLYDLKKPRHSHISVDSGSCFLHFQRLIITMTVIAVLAIGLRSVLIYLNQAINSYLVSLILLCFTALIILIVLGIYMSIHVLLSKSKNIIDGKVIERIEHKNEFTYNVKYTVNNCLFTFLFNSKDEM